MSMKKPSQLQRTIQRSVSLDLPDDEPAMSQSSIKSSTAHPSLISKWKNSLRRKMAGSPASSVTGRGEVVKYDLEQATIDLNLTSFDELPTEYPSDIFDDDEELSVRICREGVRSCLLEMMRSSGGDLKLLESIEDSSLETLPELTGNERKVALLWCAFNRRRDLLQQLLSLKPAPSEDATVGDLLEYYTVENNLTALHLAAFSGSTDCVRFLIQAGAKVDSKRWQHSLSPLHCAALGHSTECIRMLVNAGAPVNAGGQSRRDSVTTDDAASQNRCQKGGSWRGQLRQDSSFEEDTPTNLQQDTPLHCAIKANAADCVSQLLDVGADPTTVGEGGLAPIHIAADLGYTDCLRALLETKKIDVDAKSKDRRGNSALHFAAEEECPDSVRVLLDYGADAMLRNTRGQTALHVASRVQSVECLRLLLPRSDVNATDDERRTALHMAVGRAANAAETVELLVSAPGVDINCADRYGLTPLHTAALNELPNAAAVLIRSGADLTARNRRGTTALGLVNRKTPGALCAIEELLDSSIRMSYETRRDRDCELKLDFRPLLTTSNVEVSLLSTFIAEGHPEVLQHPLCQAFLHLKWQTIRKFYLCRVLLSLIFVVCLSLYCLIFLSNDCAEEFFKRRQMGSEMPVTSRSPQDTPSGASGTTPQSSIVFPGPAGNSRTSRQAKGVVQTPSTEARKPAEVATCTTSYSYLFGLLSTEDDNSALITQDLLSALNYLLLALALVEICRKFYGLVTALSVPTASSASSALFTYLCQLDNILEWFALLSVPLMSFTFWEHPHTWQRHLAAFAVLAGWTNLMIMIGQLPLFGAYVAMYTCVLREFIKLLSAYICLLIGFAISFCIVFQRAGNSSFSNPLMALLKVLVMMTGELEFEDLLIKNDAETVVVQAPPIPVATGISGTGVVRNISQIVNNTVVSGVGTNSQSIPGPSIVVEGANGLDSFLDVSSQLIFVICLLLLTVALMNLLVGIAVHDIHGLRTSAGLVKLTHQTDLIGYVENSLSRFCSCTALRSSFADFLTSKLRCCVQSRRARKNSVVMHIKPHNPRDTRLPPDVVKAALDVAKSHGKTSSGYYKTNNSFLYQRQSSQHTNADSVSRFNLAPPPQSSANPPASIPRRRTMYIRNETRDRSSEDSDVLQVSELKQLKEEVDELRQILKTNQAMLRQLLAIHDPPTSNSVSE